MTFVPAMLIVWGVFFVFFVAARIYAARLSRDEDDQLILQDSSVQLKAEQTAIAGMVNRFRPVKLTATWALGAMSLFVAIYFVRDMINQFK
jgi:hypothetical protein